MKIIALDDEAPALNTVLAAIRTAIPEAELSGFTDPAEAIRCVQENDVNICFTDIAMGDITGLDVARQMKKCNPQINIIFVTAYSEYMMEAIRIHSSGYLMKPVSPESIKREMDNLLYPLEMTSYKVYAKTFGNFDLVVDGEAVEFHLSKAKEMLAYLVDRSGSGATRMEMAAALFEGQPYSRKMQDYLSKIYKSLRDSLKEVGCEDMLQKGRNLYRIDPELLHSDLEDYHKGYPYAINAFHGEYMAQYNWGRESIGQFYIESSGH